MGIIRQLSENIANQIAAGEVVQRPASVVKEIMENAIDAGADDLRLIIKDGGRTLIQLIDNGRGMTTEDAVKCFDRHATSKISSADDLFNLHTFGFRGEALASIASIAHVELKTRFKDDEVGTKIEIEGSQQTCLEPCSVSKGTSFAIKNLFFNVPARRSFLKSDTVEFRHILDEFNRVALIYNEISFSLINNGKEVVKLPKSTLKQRIVNLMGGGLNNALYPIHLDTEMVEITGFVGKPEAARKIKGNQFFFCNGRFVKSPYFNHAIEEAFKESISGDEYPTYFVYFKCDPSRIDVNIHPTKTEVKFLDDRAIYTFLRSAVREAIGKFGYVDRIDFESVPTFDFNPQPSAKSITEPKAYNNAGYNPFRDDHTNHNSSNLKNWEKLFSDTGNIESRIENEQLKMDVEDEYQTEKIDTVGRGFLQVNCNYIVSTVKSGLAIINRRAAVERIMFDRFMKIAVSNRPATQTAMFPQTFELSPQDAEILRDTIEDVKSLGFDIGEFGGNTFVINGTPTDIELSEAQDIIEGMLNTYKMNMMEMRLDRRSNIILSTARRVAARECGQMTSEEMEGVVNSLFQCETHDVSPSGKEIIRIITNKEIEELI